MRKLYFIVFLVILITGCTQPVDLSQYSDEEIAAVAERVIICNSPYIRFEARCCVDQNNNRICDAHENVPTGLLAPFVETQATQEQIDAVIAEYTLAQEPLAPSIIICGNNLIENTEICDRNSQLCIIDEYPGTQVCNNQCTGYGNCIPTQSCGDRIVNGPESCDDGNTNPHDGCANCVVQQGWQCVQSPSVCTRATCPIYRTDELPPCVTATCDPAVGLPVFALDNSRCNDNNACTIDICSSLGCENSINFEDPTCATATRTCLDQDGDGVYEFNSQTCSYGRDICLLTYQDISPAQYDRYAPQARAVNIGWDISSNTFSNLPSFELSKDNLARIQFLRPVNLIEINSSGCFTPIQIDPLLEIEERRVEIDTTTFNNLDVPATITFYNINFNNPSLLKDGEACSPPECVIVNRDTSQGTLTVEVSGFSEYEVIDSPTQPNSGSSGGGTGGGGGGGGGGGTSRTPTTIPTFITTSSDEQAPVPVEQPLPIPPPQEIAPPTQAPEIVEITSEERNNAILIGILIGIAALGILLGVYLMKKHTEKNQ